MQARQLERMSGQPHDLKGRLSRDESLRKRKEAETASLADRLQRMTPDTSASFVAALEKQETRWDSLQDDRAGHDATRYAYTFEAFYRFFREYIHVRPNIGTQFEGKRGTVW